MQTELQDRISRIKLTALMRARECMGPVELVNWWTRFLKDTRKAGTFDALDEKIQEKILYWESNPYKVIGS